MVDDMYEDASDVFKPVYGWVVQQAGPRETYDRMLLTGEQKKVLDELLAQEARYMAFKYKERMRWLEAGIGTIQSFEENWSAIQVQLFVLMHRPGGRFDDTDE